jgi:hypothetical protein
MSAPIATFDIETDPFKKFRSPVPFLAGFFDGKTHQIFKGDDCVSRCWKVMRKFKGNIYAHNGGKFDFRYLLKQFQKADAKFFPIKGRIARVKIPDGPTFLDSYCILPVPLKATGGKLEMDYRKLERDVRELYMPEIIRYLKADLETLHEKVSEFVDEYGHGVTLAGRTFAQFKQNFDLEPPKTNEFQDRKFRRFYYGGRVEFFELGHVLGRFRLIDINSAYPAAMVKSHAFGLTFDLLQRVPRNEERAQRCFVHLTGDSLGGLPWRNEENALSFGAHSGEFFVTGWEYVAAKKLGKIGTHEILAVHEPLECKSFGKFVDYFYRQKSQSVKGSSEELFAKLFLNSAYGRFGLNAHNFRETTVTAYRIEPDENVSARKRIEALVSVRHPELKGQKRQEKCAAYWRGYDEKWELANDFEEDGISVWEKKTKLKKDSFYNVATAASVTGCVRAFMMESLAAVTRPVYCDTDSIICEDTGALKIGASLGEWKIECDSENDGVYIGGKKLFAFKIKDGKKPWKLSSKGVRLSAEEIISVCKGNAVVSTLDAPTFSLFTTKSLAGSSRDFVTRTTRRDDQRKRKGIK